jgi:uncharacterized protein (TIGR02099 family)
MLALLLLAAVAWGVLHWVIVPRIDQFRPSLERLATRRLGAPVSIGAIRAQSNGLAPSVELTGITVRDAQGRAGLTIARAQVAFSVRSLLRGGVEQLALQGVRLDIRRTAQGRLLAGGLDISGDAGGAGAGNTRAEDWFFAQPEFVLQGGAVRWIDDTRPAAPPVALSNLQLVIRRTHGRQHQLRLDATPDSPWGAPLTITGQFQQPMLARHSGRWRDWDGQAYALLPRVDISRLRQYVDLRHDWGVEITQGQGALRLWLQMRRGQVTSATADLALGAVTATLGRGLEPLALSSLSGRLGWERQDGRERITTRNLRFADREGLVWPGGNFQLSFEGGGGGQAEGGALQADQLDLGALAKIARRLPLPPNARAQLEQHPVTGRVESIQAHWSGGMDAPRDWQLSARLSDLTVGAQAVPPRPDGAPRAGIPGIERAAVTVQATPGGGQIDLGIRDGALTFPGVFEQPRIPLQTLTVRALWQTDAKTGRIAVQVPRAVFANADAAGHLRADWHTGEGAGPARFPGVLDLDGKFDRADGARVYRYLPLSIPQQARDYVRDAVQRGQARDMAVRVAGDLRHVPFDHEPKTDARTDASPGQFRFDGQVSGVTLAYVPARLLHPGAPAWPALEDLSGELIFDRASMQVKNAHGRAQIQKDWQFTRIDAGIADLAHTRVLVSADGHGPLASALAIVRDSAIGRLLHGALDDVSANGNAALRLTLDLPVNDLAQSAKVAGNVALDGNTVQLAPGAPAVAQARGTVAFDQSGFTLKDLRGQALGGPVRISGGGQPGAASNPVVVHIAGAVSARNLSAMTDWPAVAALARRANGQAAYQAELQFRDTRPALTVTSDLNGLAFDLPEPLNKPADAHWPLRFQDRPQGDRHDTIEVTLDKRLSVRIERADGGPPTRGAYALGATALVESATAPLPASGIRARIDVPRLDVAAWSAAIDEMAGKTPHGSQNESVQGSANAVKPAEPDPASPDGATVTDATAATPVIAEASAAPPAASVGASDGKSADTSASALSAQDFLPATWSLHTNELLAGSRSLHAVTASGTRAGDIWHSSIQARELAGTIQYRQAPGGQPGTLHARLTRLSIPASRVAAATGNAEDADNPDAGDPPQYIPALDVVADQFEVAGKSLGKLTIQATNQAIARGPGRAPVAPERQPANGAANELANESVHEPASESADESDPPPVNPSGNEWRLDHLALEMPEATLTATGHWAGHHRHPAAENDAERHTSLRFTLDLRDAGALLTRLGMPGTLAHGAGKLEGHLSWHGAPYAPDTATLNGQLHLDIGKGQFLKTDPGMAKLLGVLSLQALPRRLKLDFRDIFSAGFAFDSVHGEARIFDGVVSTNDLQIKGASAVVTMDGTASLVAQTQGLHVVVVPHIDAGTAALAATAVNPAIGIGAFVAQWLLQKPLSRAATREFNITGDWADPQVVALHRSAQPQTGQTNAPDSGAAPEANRDVAGEPAVP